MADSEDTGSKELFAGDKWYSKRVGPLPVGAWVGIVGGSLAIAYYRKRKGTATTTAPATGPGTTVDTSTAPGVGNLAGYGQIGAGVVGGTGTPEITDNTSWYRAALRELLAEGYDPTAADTALRNYVDGNQLTANQDAMVQIALMKIGPMPYPPPPAVITPTPPAPPPPPAPDTTVITTNPTRVRSKMNRLREVAIYTGQNVSDWPQVAPDGPLNAPDMRQATIAFVTRLNEGRANAHQTLYPVDGNYTATIDSEATAAAAYFKVAY